MNDTDLFAVIIVLLTVYVAVSVVGAVVYIWRKMK